jgi:glycosyltransferase involved in cell wall biosynthesis
LLLTLKPDVIYINSFFSRPFSMAALLAWHSLGKGNQPGLILAPRGEFADGALHLKRLRKSLYMHLVRLLGGYRNVVWHASTLFEEKDILRQFSRTDEVTIAGPITGAHRAVIATALDMPSRSDQSTGQFPEKQPGTLKVVFLARVSRMKNLQYALEVVRGLRGQVSFTIYGPLEDKNYWADCQRLIADMPANILVRYGGAVEHNRVQATIGAHDIFLLPTLGENFGHVIYEALSAGCPVVISDRTPWRELEESGVGWDLPLDAPDSFRGVLQQCIDMTADGFRTLRCKAHTYAEEINSSTAILDQNRKMLNQGLSYMKRKRTSPRAEANIAPNLQASETNKQ